MFYLIQGDEQPWTHGPIAGSVTRGSQAQTNNKEDSYQGQVKIVGRPGLRCPPPIWLLLPHRWENDSFHCRVLFSWAEPNEPEGS